MREVTRERLTEGGYNLSSGLHWARKYRAWTLTSFAGADLSIRKSKIPPRLRQPHQTERIVLKVPISFAVEEKRKKRNETLEGVEEIRGEDDRGVHLEPPAEDEDPDPTLLQDIDRGQLDEVEVIAGIMHDEKGEDVEVVAPGSKEDKDAVDDVADPPHVPTGKAKDGIICRNNLGKTVKPDGFRTMKTTRPAGFTPEEWATLRNARDVDEEGMIHPKKKDGAGSSKDAKGQRSEREKDKSNAQRTMGW